MERSGKSISAAELIAPLLQKSQFIYRKSTQQKPVT